MLITTNPPKRLQEICSQWKSRWYAHIDGFEIKPAND